MTMVRLDSGAPDAASECLRFLEGDYLGKLLFKSLLVSHCGIDEHQLRIPLSRYGDPAGVSHSPQDATVRVDDVPLHVEIKLARLNICDRYRGGTSLNWAFNNLTKTPSGADKQYDLLVAIGLVMLGAEHTDYWSFERGGAAAVLAPGVPLRASPNHPQFLARCGFFIQPFAEVKAKKNFFRRSFASLSDIRDPSFAAGSEPDRCAALWHGAVNEALRARGSTGQP